MKLLVEVHLGNDAMRSAGDVLDRLVEHLGPLGGEPLVVGDGGGIRDVNGNTVGRWEVVDS